MQDTSSGGEICLQENNLSKWKNQCKSLRVNDDALFELFLNSYKSPCITSFHVTSAAILKQLDYQRQVYSKYCDFHYQISGADTNSYSSAHACVLEACLGEEFLQYLELLPQTIKVTLALRSINSKTIIKVPASFQNLVHYCYTGNFGLVGENYINTTEIEWLIDQLVDDPEIKDQMKQVLHNVGKADKSSLLSHVMAEGSEAEIADEDKQVASDISNENLDSSQDSPASLKDLEDYCPSENEDIDSDYEIEDGSSDESINLDIADLQEMKDNNETSVSSYKCSQCEDTFTSKIDLAKHLGEEHLQNMQKQTRSKTLRNREVNFVQLSLVKSVNRTKKAKLEGAIATCCDKEFFSRFAMGVHIAHHHRTVYVNCTECDDLVMIEEFSLHYQTCHKFPLLESPNQTGSTTSIAMQTNNKNENSEISVEKSLWAQERKCPECQQKMSVAKYLHHLNEQYKRSQSVMSLDSYRKLICIKFQCHLCQKANFLVTKKAIRLNSLLRKHINNYHLADSVKDEKVACDQCGRIVMKYFLESHKKNHLRVSLSYSKMVICDICGKSVRKLRLSRHRRTHFDKFPCCYCSKVFNRKVNLQVHERIHTGEKPFVCDTCGKAFHQNVELRLHNRQHEKEKAKQNQES